VCVCPEPISVNTFEDVTPCLLQVIREVERNTSVRTP
jgi:hypothetical protein